MPKSRLRTGLPPRFLCGAPTGHKTEAVYKRYAIVNEKDIAEGLAKVARFREDQAIPEPTVVPFHATK